MKSDKKQTYVMIGIVLLILSGIMLYVTMSAPKVYENKQYSTTLTKSTTQKETTITVKYPLNINTASVDELVCIKGLSEKMAFSIVAYREQFGMFEDVSEIMNIKGIGKKTYYEIAPYLEV